MVPSVWISQVRVKFCDIIKISFVFIMFFLSVQCSNNVTQNKEQQLQNPDFSHRTLDGTYPFWGITNNAQLSTEQKLQDFDFLYQTLEENYPFFGVSERQFNNDWLSKKSEYEKRIKNTPDDSTFLITLSSIIQELRCPHLSSISFRHEMMLDVYRRATNEQPKYAKWVEVLEKSAPQSIHWEKIWENATGYSKQTQQTQQKQMQENFYSDSLLHNDKIGIMRIKSFLYDNLANDSIQIISFLKIIQDYNCLIIDIQDNGGGSSNYWKNYIVGKISDTSIIFPRNQVAKKGSLNKHFFSEIEQWEIVSKQNAVFPNVPDELLDGTYLINSLTDTVMPNNPIPFKGKIYVLVNHMVVSASDDFAYFCKVSKWATVAGVQTMGEGGGGEPTLFMLPNSGITFRHPSIVGLNEDGSFNFETRTIPNIEINANNSDERLERLINYIKQKE